MQVIFEQFLTHISGFVHVLPAVMPYSGVAY